MLNAFADTTSTTETTITGRANRSLIRATSPWPLARLSRAAVSCTADASGRQRGAIHTRSKRNLAPTCEYVPMPAGSSSAAPVMKPGPVRLKYPNPRSWCRSLERARLDTRRSIAQMRWWFLGEP